VVLLWWRSQHSVSEKLLDRVRVNRAFAARLKNLDSIVPPLSKGKPENEIVDSVHCCNDEGQLR